MTKTFLYIAGTKVPVLNDAPIPINYQIEDIRNPESTAVTHATTIELPSTKLLDEIFEFSYQPNIKFQTFNPNFRTTCEYWVNNQKIFEGSVKLNKCIWDKDKKVTKYICDFFGIKANLFYEIGQQLLVGNDNPTQDLDFSIYDHTLNQIGRAHV